VLPASRSPLEVGPSGEGAGSGPGSGIGEGLGSGTGAGLGSGTGEGPGSGTGDGPGSGTVSGVGGAGITCSSATCPVGVEVGSCSVGEPAGLSTDGAWPDCSTGPGPAGAPVGAPDGSACGGRPSLSRSMSPPWSTLSAYFPPVRWSIRSSTFSRADPACSGLPLT
jgi:hypothetical protein